MIPTACKAGKINFAETKVGTQTHNKNSQTKVVKVLVSGEPGLRLGFIC